MNGRERILENVNVLLLIIGAAFYFNPIIVLILIMAASPLQLYIDLRLRKAFSWLPAFSLALSIISICFLAPPLNKSVGGGAQLALLLTSMIPISVDVWDALGGSRRKLMIVSLFLILIGALFSGLYGKAPSVSLLSSDFGSSQMVYDLIILSPYSATSLMGLVLYIAVMIDLLTQRQSK